MRQRLNCLIGTLRRHSGVFLLCSVLGWGLSLPVAIAAQAKALAAKAGVQGYYRAPTISGETIVFVAGRDLWSVSKKGGLARRLTSHAGPEGMPRFSPDGKWLAFSAFFDGDYEVYIMPAQGGVPRRLTWRAGPDIVLGWTPDSKKVIFRSYRRYYHWNTFVYTAEIAGKKNVERVKVGYAAWLSYSPDGKRVAFNRSGRDSRNWKRYTGGWSQDIWVGSTETQKFKRLTRFPGTDANPMWYKDRIYFISDRTGIRNLFSVDPEGKKIWQHTFHKAWDVRWPSLGGDTIVYQHGADLWTLDLLTNKSQKVPIALSSGALQRRRKFVRPMRFFQGFDLGPKGQRLLINARGDLFNIPVKKGITFRVTRSSRSHEKFASFSPDGKKIAAISDRSGEEEIVFFDPLGEKAPKSVTKGGKAWSFWPVWSPDGKSLAYADKNLKLWIVSSKTGKKTLVPSNSMWEITNYRWSPDSRYLAYVIQEANGFHSIFLYDTKSKDNFRATYKWTDDFSPAWSPDGKRLYFLSRREINPFIGSFDFTEMVDKSTKLYVLILDKKTTTPFAAQDALLNARNKEEQKALKKSKKSLKKSLKKLAKKSQKELDKAMDKAASQSEKEHPGDKKELKKALKKALKRIVKKTFKKLAKKLVKKAKKAMKKALKKSKKSLKKALKKIVGKKCKCKKGKKGKKGKKCKCKKKVVVRITRKGLLSRAYALPGVRAGHYYGLTALKDRLYVVSFPSSHLKHRRGRSKSTLMMYLLKGKKFMPFAPGVASYSVSWDLKFIGLRYGHAFRVVSTRAMRPPKGKKGMVKLNGLRLMQIDPTAEWRQIFLEAWRLQRDFYWAPNMAGIDWEAVKQRNLKLLPRLLTRSDLNDLLGQTIAELGTSHTYVWGGDVSRFSQLPNAVLGAEVGWDQKVGMLQFTRIFKGAPWAQQDASPLVQHHLKIKAGTYLLAIDGQAIKSSRDYYRFLQGKAGQLVSLLVNNKAERKGARRVLVKAIYWFQERHLRYIDWVESRRIKTSKLSGGKVGYIHLPNMSYAGLLAFYRMWYPQLHKHAMVIDLRGNGGGFVSQLILQKMMRKLYAFFKARNAPINEKVPDRTFHGHVAVVTNQNAGSDGDIFCKSFQLLKLGPVFGTRTWGGVVGIRANKRFMDGGLTTQPEYAWWSPSLGWSLENKGVVPDVEVDNSPADMEKDYDRQLRATIDWLLKKLKQDPKTLPRLPPYPNKSVKSFLKRWKKWQVSPAPKGK